MYLVQAQTLVLIKCYSTEYSQAVWNVGLTFGCVCNASNVFVWNAYGILNVRLWTISPPPSLLSLVYIAFILLWRRVGTMLCSRISWSVWSHLCSITLQVLFSLESYILPNIRLIIYHVAIPPYAPTASEHFFFHNDLFQFLLLVHCVYTLLNSLIKSWTIRYRKKAR